MSKSKTSKRTLIAEERRSKAIELRKAGVSYAQIADALGTTPSNVHKMVCKSLDQIRENTAEQADELRTLEMERLDKLFQHAYHAVVDGDVRAIDQALRCMERRAKLTGIDAATRTEISGALLTSPEWIELKTLLVQTLGRYPDAQQAVLAAIAPKEQNT